MLELPIVIIDPPIFPLENPCDSQSINPKQHESNPRIESRGRAEAQETADADLLFFSWWVLGDELKFTSLLHSLT